MIVVDTGAVIALVDADEARHRRIVELFHESGSDWLIPWAVLPEVDHLVRRRLGSHVAEVFLDDVLAGHLNVEWGTTADLRRAAEIDATYADLQLGLVDSSVMATAERLGARAIVTLDERDFGSVELRGTPELWPRDLA